MLLASDHSHQVIIEVVIRLPRQGSTVLHRSFHKVAVAFAENCTLEMRTCEGTKRDSDNEFGLEWFAFTSAIRFGQGRCSGHFHSTTDGARDVVQVACQ